MKVENLKETIKKSRPNVKESTIKMYSTNLNKLRKMFESDGYSFLENVSEVKDKLKDLSYTTQRNYYNSIIILLMALDKDKSLIEKYNDMRDELNKKYEDENAKGTISEKQKGNFVELSEVQKMLGNMEKDLKGWKKKESFSPSEWNLLQAYIIFKVHLKLPMRNDLSGCLIITKRLYNKLSEKDKEEHNYLVLEKNSAFFVMNQFKTNKKYKQLNIPVSKETERILRAYIKKIDGKVLFKSSVGTPLSRNAISQLLLKFSKKYLGKNISTTMIRKIVLSDAFAELNKKKEEMSKITGHSTQIMDKVYIKEGQGTSDKSSKE